MRQTTTFVGFFTCFLRPMKYYMINIHDTNQFYRSYCRGNLFFIPKIIYNFLLKIASLVRDEITHIARKELVIYTCAEFHSMSIMGLSDQLIINQNKVLQQRLSIVHNEIAFYLIRTAICLLLLLILYYPFPSCEKIVMKFIAFCVSSSVNSILQPCKWQSNRGTIF